MSHRGWGARPDRPSNRTVVVVAACVWLAMVVTGCAQEVRVFNVALPQLTSGETSAARGGPSTVPATGPAAVAGVETSEAIGTSALTRRAPLRMDPGGLGPDTAAALAHAAAIASFGAREGGSAAERKAAAYVAARLSDLGYVARMQEFALPNGLRSTNVIAVATGRDDTRRLLLGAHLDSKPPSPGANDNASGCGLLLELASILATNPPPVDVEFVFWGSEEFLPEGTDSHHLGSRHHAGGLTPAQRDRLVGVVSVDMVGVGSSFHVRTMERGPQTLRQMLLAVAKSDGVALSFLKDRGRTGWSDHEPYELRGIPAAWLEWQDDPNYHTPRDTADKLERRPMQVTGEFLAGFIYGLDDAAIRALERGR